MRTRRRFFGLALAVAISLTVGCEREHLRGRAEPSADGQTYLIIDDNNGGTCGPMFVDDREWPTPINRPHPVTPGKHVIRCGDGGGTIEFEIPPGATFHFDYWGP